MLRKLPKLFNDTTETAFNPNQKFPLRRFVVSCTRYSPASRIPVVWMGATKRSNCQGFQFGKYPVVKHLVIRWRFDSGLRQAINHPIIAPSTTPSELHASCLPNRPKQDLLIWNYLLTSFLRLTVKRLSWATDNQWTMGALQRRVVNKVKDVVVVDRCPTESLLCVIDYGKLGGYLQNLTKQPHSSHVQAWNGQDSYFH
ncbi:hypothetical protein CEXT_369631 [Caerostris extrusa]|uniref:Uncharacterized protein n=1 Tax=Caerostris extrusa TaxID=172846 RepID=A0AAV4XD05_CAEEX|nr:hypothetical protein CEXT_369631 [Caerostris extrusa]